MADRNSIIEKIKALLAKTTANGATEAEMLAALEKAAAMRDAYEISDEELQLTKEEQVALHAEPPDATDPHKIKWQLGYAVGQFCNVQIYRSGGEGIFKCIGLPSDVQFAMWLLDTLADFTGGTSPSRSSLGLRPRCTHGAATPARPRRRHGERMPAVVNAP